MKTKKIKIKNRGYKQVRENMWECNSSSSHSVSIRNKKIPKDPVPVREFVVDNILYPDVLDDYTSSFGYDSCATICDTKDKKAAIVCNWINYNARYNSSFSKENDGETFVTQLLQKFVKACGYDGVDVERLSTGFYPYSEDGVQYLPYEVDDETKEEFEEAVMKLVKTVLDDNLIIEESDIEN